MAIPEAVGRIEDPLVRAYTRAFDRVLGELASIAASPEKWRRGRKLIESAQAISAQLGELDQQAYRWVTGQLPRVYEMGAVQAVASAGKAGAFSWDLIHREAVQVLSAGLMDELLAGTRHTIPQVVGLMRSVASDAALQAVIEGRTANQAARELQDVMARQGVLTLRYNDGSVHAMREYAPMAIRTTTAKAYNYGTLNGAAAVGVEWWEVFDGPGCGLTYHGDPTMALGSIITTEDAQRYPISHPNCRRSFGPRPDITSASQRPGQGQVTTEQVAAQRAQDRARSALQARRARSAGRSGVRAQQRATQEAREALEARGASLAQASTQTLTVQRAPAQLLSRNITHEELAAHTQAFAGALPADQVSALRSYQQIGYEKVNGQLRGHRDPEDRWTDVISRLDAAMAASPGAPTRMTTYRISREQRLFDAQPGMEFVDDGFTSTSIDRELMDIMTPRTSGPDVIMHIRVPEGSRGIYMETAARDLEEFEWLLPHGSRFRVVEILESVEIKGRSIRQIAVEVLQ